MTDFQYIDQQKALDTCCLSLQQNRLLAIDTEFVRERTFYPQPGLIQVSDGRQIYLIDPNANIELKGFFKILEDDRIRIIMHSASEDIELFYHMGCGEISNLFDTQIASAWLGMGQSLSLQKLIETYQSMTIEKQHSRTNWLKRPLSTAQLDYAAIDVLYLNEICQQQEKQLNDKSFLDNMLQDCQLRSARRTNESDDNLAYLKVKKAISATATSLSRLKNLAAWREQKAKSDDKPRQHILKDLQLLAISIENPQSLSKLASVSDVPSFVIRRYGEQMLTVLQSTREGDKPNPVIKFRSITGAGATLDAFRELLNQISSTKNIPMEVLPSKRWLEQFLVHYCANWYAIPEGWNGWRKNLLEQPFLDIINRQGFNLDT